MDIFDPTTITRGSKCVLIGAQNVGKTTMILRLLPMLDLRQVHVHTNDEYAIPRYEKQGYDVVEEYNEAAECDAIVLDHFSYHEELCTDKFRRLMQQNRATVFITMLYGMTPAYAFDYIFLFPTPIVNIQRRLFDFYCRPGLFQSLDDFGQILLRETKWIDNNGFTRIKEGACIVIAHQNLIAKYSNK